MLIVENEENICFDVEPVEAEKQTIVLTLEEKLQNAVKSIKNEKNSYDNFDVAKNFIKDCLVPEEMLSSDAESYIKYKLGKEFHFEGRDGNKMLTDLKKLYDKELKFQAQMKHEETKKAVTPRVIHKGIVNDKVCEFEKYVYPEGYSVKNGMIIKIKDQFDPKTGDTETVEVAISLTPFILCKRTQPELNKNQYYTIRYPISRFSLEQGEFTVPTTEFSDLNVMHKTLAAHGINVLAEQRKDINEYINKCIYELGHLLKVEPLIERNGWNDDNTVFAMGKKGITADKIIPVTTLVKGSKHCDSFVQKGTLKEWVSTIEPIMKYDLSRFMFYDSMAAPLIKLLNQENIVTCHSGESSRGKTLLAWIATSTMGNPKELQCKADSTANAVLAHVVGFCDMPVDIEEVTIEKTLETMPSVIYTLSNGMDKGRCTIDGTLRDDIKSFRTSARITTENPLSDYVKNVGGLVRNREQCELLPKDIKLADLTSAAKDGIQENYGFFYPIYIQHIMKNMDRLKSLYDDAYKSLNDIVVECVPKESLSIVCRQIKPYALDVVAGILVEEVFKNIGMTIKSKEAIEAIVLDNFMRMVLDKPVDLPYMKALKEILAWVGTTQEFVKNGEKTYSKDKSGEITATDIRIVGKKFTEKMKEIGLSSNVKEDFKTFGLIKNTNEVILIDGISQRGIKIDRKLMDKKLGLTANNDKRFNTEICKQEVLKTIKFLIEELGKEVAEPYLLKVNLGYEVTEFLNKLEKEDIIKRAESGYCLK